MTDPPGHPAGIGARLRAATLETRLAFLSAGVTAVVVAVVFLALRARADASVRSVLAAELTASQVALQRLQHRSMAYLLQTSSLVTANPTLIAALETRRVDANAGLAPQPIALATIQREVDGIARELDRDLLVVTDDSGLVIAAQSRQGALGPGLNLMHIPAVRYALTAERATDDSSSGVMNVAGVPLQVGCVAILVHGYPVGALILGERLEHFIPASDDSAGMKAVVASGNVVLASTLNAAPAGAPWHVAVPARAAAANEAGRTTLRIADEDYVAATLPLGLDQDGQPATLYLMRSLTSAMLPIDTALEHSFFVAGAMTVLLVGLGTAFVSRLTLRPLARFVTFLRRGADTYGVARFDSPPAGAEIGTLIEAYNHLIDSLSTEHAELERRTVELATTNESLVLQVRERERAEQALRESAEQLRHSQKMEALGTLAGGVAHDFNNLLSVILGYAQLTLQDLPAESAPRSHVVQIGSAANRATELVKQLLAFSRKQVMQPQIVDLNRVVRGMQPLLRPLIREDIDVRIALEPSIARMEADPGQLEQVILNLVVNARDAMPAGGTLTIETSNVNLDDRFSHRPDAIAGGPAVMLAVTDTGEGMDEATRARIFEPFFTTKAPGKGTGLGLSTVYGIVRQSGGNITVYSTKGEGCTFRCYFPSTAEVTSDPSWAPVLTMESRGTETVLVAEDQPQLRALMQRGLTERGYRVLEAGDGREALDVASRHDGPIHLLLTDVVMPNMGGQELAERLVLERPSTRVLFISGYSDDAIWLNGVFGSQSAFLQKPVEPDVLARKIREALDGEQLMGKR